MCDMMIFRHQSADSTVTRQCKGGFLLPFLPLRPEIDTRKKETCSKKRKITEQRKIVKRLNQVQRLSILPLISDEDVGSRTNSRRRQITQRHS